MGAIDGWKDFIQALNTRFGSSGFEDPTGPLAKLWQTTTVQEYQEQFEGLANRTEGLSKDFMVNCFVAGLKKRYDWGSRCSDPHPYQL